MEELSINQTKKQSKYIQELLAELFPKLGQILYNRFNHRDEDNTLFKNKRLASPKYFNRYFSYVVIKGEISDVAIESIFVNLTKASEKSVINKIKLLIKEGSPSDFLHILRSVEGEFNWNDSKKIASALAKTASIFPRRADFYFSFGFQSPRSQAAIFIVQLIKKHSNKIESLEFSKYLMVKAMPFEFAYELNGWLRGDEISDDTIFSPTENMEISIVLLRRALTEAKGKPIFERFPEHSTRLFAAWSKYDKVEMQEYLNSILEKDSSMIFKLLLAFTPTGVSSAVDGTFKIDFSQDQFNFFSSVFDTISIKNIIEMAYLEKGINQKEVIWTRHNEHTQSDINISKQYLYWLEQSLAG